ncbi:toxin-antitoxin system HicB family antitoxin [Extensimonas vulgaris]|uniref:HicB-like protein involved in pilus formation n=1 Tax=Extensimonas vulgaris TaxID=1031594 RepID=A0A369AHC1_9BURK|nr:toxin-antitoxin system HicB family antitoxin [Extensimonas vulgaris]RCX07547.1 HicB-like protein involved in pilus formation [Extensimonas vulgaris]TWI33714.1 HicB-like protein involved in pilus formation [Extensimonas vulgaris]TXD12931.1 toxin-antitoxin system HicB family antitoxin [Extensimonas vulgaris]
MSTFALRLPESLYAHAKRLAERDQASLNQFITVAVAEKVSALETAEFFAQRAANAQKDDLAKLLLQVKNRQPLEGDELPK